MLLRTKKKKLTKIVRPPRLVVVSHNLKSNALKAIANSLSEKVGYRVFRVTPDRIRGRVPIRFEPGIDKTVQFARFHGSGVPAPGYTLSSDAVGTLTTKRIVARTLTSASEGKGIVIFDKEETAPYAPLYTEYIVKKKEFRVHVWDNEVIHVSEKRKKKSFDQERDNLVRNTANGYVFCTENVVEPTDLRTVALAAVTSLGRRYGAVDCIWNEKQNKCFVLEVNSRPGLVGNTIEKYTQAILKGVNNVSR